MIKEFYCQVSMDPCPPGEPKRSFGNGFRALIQYINDDSGTLHGCVFYPANGFIESGETQACAVIPLFPTFHSEQATPNQKFKILEGNKPIGKGTIVRVESLEDLKN